MCTCRDVCDAAADAPSGLRGGPGPRPRRVGDGAVPHCVPRSLGELAGTWKGSGSLARGHWAPSADKAACDWRLSGPSALNTEQ